MVKKITNIVNYCYTCPEHYSSRCLHDSLKNGRTFTASETELIYKSFQESTEYYPKWCPLEDC